MSDRLDPAVARELFYSHYERPGDVFVDVLRRDGHIIAPGVYNAMGAYIASRLARESWEKSAPCAFNAVYGSGWAISAMDWRHPDMGFHDRTLMALIAKHIVRAAYPLPVILDAETGFGSEPVTLAWTVQDYHSAGVALAHLEDQGTRRCGNLGGKFCISPQDMVTKIRMWLVVSKEINTSMRLKVRTDAFTAAGGGLDDAIERMKRYMDVDYQGLRPTVSWADALIDLRDIERWATELKKHDPNMILGINYSPNKDWTGYYRKNYNAEPPTYEQLKQLGFSVIWHTILQSRADMESTWNTFSQMANEGAKVLWDLHERQRDHPVGDAQAMSNYKPWQVLDKFIGGQAAQERYDKSQGYGKESK